MVHVSSYARQVRQEFKAWQKLHPNFMTPKVREVTIVDDMVIEVSEGVGIEYEPIYGVSVFGHLGEFEFMREHEYKGKLFRIIHEALEYADELKHRIEHESRETGYMTPGDDPTMPGGGPPVYHGPEERYGG